MVSDTAEMAEPQLDCTAVNSCPNRPAGQGTTDPIHNLMVRLTMVSVCGQHVAHRRRSLRWSAETADLSAKFTHACRLAVALHGLADEL